MIRHDVPHLLRNDARQWLARPSQYGRAGAIRAGSKYACPSPRLALVTKGLAFHKYTIMEHLGLKTSAPAGAIMPSSMEC